MLFWVFEIEYFDNNKWKKEFFFYCLDNVLLDFRSDWRLAWIQDKRKKAKLLGVVDGLTFPVVYPLTSTSGKLINVSTMKPIKTKKPKPSKKLQENSGFKVAQITSQPKKQQVKKSLGDFSDFKVA